MRLAIAAALLALAACSSPAQRLANDRCGGHWTVVTSKVNGRTVYRSACAKP